MSGKNPLGFIELEKLVGAANCRLDEVRRTLSSNTVLTRNVMSGMALRLSGVRRAAGKLLHRFRQSGDGKIARDGLHGFGMK